MGAGNPPTEIVLSIEENGTCGWEYRDILDWSGIYLDSVRRFGNRSGIICADVFYSPLNTHRAT